MEIAFFKTSDPKQKVYLSRLGKWAAWQYIDVDVGVIVTNNSGAIEDLRSLQRQGVGAVEEITAEEHTELLSKKKDPKQQPKNWREEFSMGQLQSTSQTSSPAEKAPVAPAAKDDATVAKLNRGTLPKSFRPKPTKAN
jgi:hypothetical protein